MIQAADAIRQARAKAGLSQSELARRCGVSQPAISAYERGVHDPSVQALRRLIAATGYDLDLALTKSGAPRRLPTTLAADRLRERRTELIDSGQRLGATNLRVFGSVARGDDREDSDIDLLVDLAHGVSLIGLGRIRETFEQVLDQRVDVVPASGLKPEARDEILAEAIPLATA